ncbi:MAG TPA: hypothetical protein VJ044_01095, partial [Candidatus Hodarchaeales archaeon]|nr:hypothetical protein [Candidatus Hodarchaeales archaeon]
MSLLARLTLKERLWFWKRKMLLFLPFWFSHHPLCRNYRKELLRVRGWYFCRGCTEVYSSLFIALTLTVILL